jgi:hypothetical protein
MTLGNVIIMRELSGIFQEVKLVSKEEDLWLRLCRKTHFGEWESCIKKTEVRRPKSVVFQTADCKTAGQKE